MDSAKFLKFSLIVILGIIFFYPAVSFGQSSKSLNVNVQVTGGCNIDGLCDSENGETIQNCPQDCKAPATAIGGGGGEIQVFQAKNIIVSNITTNSADITWLTTNFALCQLSWGVTSEYGKEVISETSYVTGHFIQLKNLEASSDYHFKLTCIDKGQQKYETKDQQFTTSTPLNNVINFTAVAGNEKITLSWGNPPDVNFDGVRILKSEHFYPLNINDGTVIYEGYGSFFEDLNLVNGKTYYYAIFTLDKKGNYSSGAIVSAIPLKDISIPVQPEIPVSPVIILKIQEITINDFAFFSEGKNRLSDDKKTIDIKPSTSLTISADCQKFSEAKTVLVNLEEKQKTYTFVLRQEDKNHSCSVSFVSPSSPGNYPLKILIINSNDEIVRQIEAELKVLKEEKYFCLVCLASWKTYLLIGLIIAFLTVFFFLKRRKKQEKNIKNKKLKSKIG